MDEQRAAQLRRSIQRCFQPLHGCSVADISLTRYRAAFEALSELIEPIDTVAIEPLSIDAMPAEWFVPAQAEEGRAILYLHSGTYVCGSMRTDRAAVTRLAELSRTCVLQFAYRLAPEHPFPAALDDALAAYRWLISQGFAPRRIALVGSGAGGGLLLALLQVLRDQDAPLPIVGACFSPLLDLTPAHLQSRSDIATDIVLNSAMLEFVAQHYCQPSERSHPLISPLHADLHGLPPLLLIVAQNELVHDDADRLWERARAQRVRAHALSWSDVCHGWQLFPAAFREGERALDQAAAYCEKYFDMGKA
ncbi:hydrolase [Dictyobacter sp. S3.2.2.5]|uniref:Hydrolase n=1 Tax=Dictyobacter halimunensis TaxID=3026934 RepID=A0ABQ6FM84_9CHLR|nr:hydrolase [Dictyobacter sp. S3.2.2.5]